MELAIPSFKATNIDESPHQGLLRALAKPGGPTESQVSKLLQALLQSPTRWLQGPVTPWQFAAGSPRQSAMQYLVADRHVWQPDIDMIWGPTFGRVKLSPIHAIELKHFALVTDRDKYIPKTRQKQGFYAGLDEAIALTLTGVDTVSLWQVFQLPWHHWRTLEEAQSEQASDNYTDYSAAYVGKLGGLIKALGLPIGYQCAGLLIDRTEDGTWREVHLIPVPDCSVVPPLNPIRGSPDPSLARQRLLEMLHIVDRCGEHPLGSR